MSDKVKLKRDSNGQYLLVKFVQVKDITPKGLKNWCKNARRKIHQRTYSTLPSSRKMYIDQVYNRETLAEFLSMYLDGGMRIQIHRFVKKKGMPKQFSSSKKIAEVEMKANDQLIIFDLKGLSKMHWWRMR